MLWPGPATADSFGPSAMRPNSIVLSLFACAAVACLHQPEQRVPETWQVRTSLHLPEGAGPFPVVLLLPGGRGAEQIGKAWPSYERYAERLAKLGVAGMVVDYARPDRGYIDERRIPELRVAIEKAKQHPALAADRVFVAGFSMGGANALMLVAASKDVAGLVTFFAPVDWRKGGMGMPPGLERQPVEYAARIKCPVLILQGTHDEITPSRQAKVLQRALADAGTEVELQMLDGAGHGFTFEGAPAGACCRYDANLTQRSAETIRDFIARHAP
jgi:dienelactone hydrolase